MIVAKILVRTKPALQAVLNYIERSRHIKICANLACVRDERCDEIGATTWYRYHPTGGPPVEIVRCGFLFTFAGDTIDDIDDALLECMLESGGWDMPPRKAAV